MEYTKKSVEEFCELKDDLVRAAKEEISKGVQHVDTKEMGEVVDMIKDLAEAEEKCWKACYYKAIVKSMHEEEEEMKRSGGRMGYDNWRYSSGRFAPTGHGHRSGFTPGDDDYEEMMMGEGWMDGSSGYSRGGSRSGSSNGQNGSSSGSRGGTMGSNGRMGYTGSGRGDHYDRYHQARMGYHESKDAASRQHMDAAARDYAMDRVEAMKEIWRDADPAMRKELKNKMTALCGELN